MFNKELVSNEKLTEYFGILNILELVNRTNYYEYEVTYSLILSDLYDKQIALKNDVYLFVSN